MSIDEVAPVSAVSPPGHYPFGVEGRVAQWDGHAWTGDSAGDAAVGSTPKWHHTFFPFLVHQWFWWMVVGSILALVPGYVAAVTGHIWIGVFTLPGFAIFMIGSVLLVDRHMHFTQLSQRRLIIIWGIISGIFAAAVGTGIESYLEPKFGIPLAIDLWCAGPVEETLKLAIPFVLLVFGSAKFKDPRAGLLLVLISGAVFGTLEAWLYMFAAGGYTPLLMSGARPTTELLHPFLTGLAAALIWLAAWRAGRAFTLAGLVGWVVAMAGHSFHDGIFSAREHGTTDHISAVPSLAQAILLTVVTIGISLIWIVIIFLVMRHAARELTPPNAISINSPHWRPQLKQWGRTKAAKQQARTA